MITACLTPDQPLSSHGPVTSRPLEIGSPKVFPPVRGTLVREVQKALLEFCSRQPQLPTVTSASGSATDPVPTGETEPLPDASPMEIDHPTVPTSPATSTPVAPSQAPPASGSASVEASVPPHGTSDPLPTSPPAMAGTSPDAPSDPSAIFYNCALPALPPGALKGVTTDTLGRFLLPAGLSISFPLLTTPTPDCPDPELICGSFTLMTPVPIYARLDHLPWTGDWDRFDQVASGLLANPRVPEPQGPTPYEDLVRTLDVLMQHPNFVSTAAQAADLAQRAAAYSTPFPHTFVFGGTRAPYAARGHHPASDCALPH